MPQPVALPPAPIHVEQAEPIALSAAIEPTELVVPAEAVAAVEIQQQVGTEPTEVVVSAPAAPLSPISLRLESAAIPMGGEFFPAEPVLTPEPVAETVAVEEPVEVFVDEPVAIAEPAERVEAQEQPTPAPEASALLSKRGIDDERAWLRKTLSQEFGIMANSIARVLSEHPGFQGALTRSSAEVLTDAVAVRLYLSEQGVEIDRALRTATVGPHVPFARCVVAGLSRLPSHRGATTFAMTPTAEQWELYRERRLFTEWGFTNSLVEPCSGQRGDVDVLVWSMTARRTKLLEPDDARTDGRVLFIPGTSFKVLDMTEAEPGIRGRILMRELASSEIDADGRVDSDRISLDELAMTSLRRCAERWAEAEPGKRIAPASAGRFQQLPGLA